MTDRFIAQQHTIDLIMVEDSVVDAELIADSLRDAGLTLTVRLVVDEPAFRAALEQRLPDAILSDWTLPDFSGRRALELARTQCPDVPFIFVSGTISESTAFEALRDGATDYVFKHQLQHLSPALIRALNEAGAQHALRESEGKYRTLFESSRDALIVLSPDSLLFSDANYSAMELFGFAGKADYLGLGPFDVSPVQQPDGSPSAEKAREMIATILREGSHFFEWEHRRLDGTTFTADVLMNRTETAGQVSVQASVRDITKRKQAEKELQKKNTEIEQFIYTVSHDLRSPLVTVKTFIGYLEKDMTEGNRDQITQDIQFINGAADKMKMLLDELLELSRIGRIETTLVSVSFRDVLTEVLDTLAGIISERKVDIRLPDTDLMLFGDRLRLCQIWQNLIENAIRYSCVDSIPRIELGVEQQREETIFSVKDNGIGIDPRYHTKIFGIFEKLDPKSPGAGMGLTLVQRVVEICGGRVWVESEGIGKGACFRFTLPQMMI